MTRVTLFGRVYRCPVCGAEVTAISSASGDFTPRCCNTDMVAKPGLAVFYRCPVCDAMVMITHASRRSNFQPRCCNTEMLRLAS